MISERSALALRYATVGLAMILITSVLVWLMVPKPGLAALALPGGEAYLWRPYTGKSVLFVRTAGLDRRHNADTVAAAVRCRGINSIAGVVWLDEIPSARVLPNIKVTDYALGAAIPGSWDMAWLSYRERTFGARLALGGSEVWLIWEQSPDMDVLLEQVERGQVATPWAIVLTAATWEGSSTEMQIKLVGIAGDVVVVAADGEPPQNILAYGTEVDILPEKPGVIIRPYASPGF